MATAALRLDQHIGARLKRAMLALLAAWLGYFAVISMTARTLNKITVPFIETPLGVFLVAQGTAVIFVAALILLVRASALTRTGR
jgi:putative solute:sodium symporter small subunit